jgi:hypothetical protein
MSHRHFCDVAGHWWECEGTARRSGTVELPSEYRALPSHNAVFDRDSEMGARQVVPRDSHRRSGLDKVVLDSDMRIPKPDKA